MLNIEPRMLVVVSREAVQLLEGQLLYPKFGGQSLHVQVGLVVERSTMHRFELCGRNENCKVRSADCKASGRYLTRCPSAVQGDGELIDQEIRPYLLTGRVKADN